MAKEIVVIGRGGIRIRRNKLSAGATRNIEVFFTHKYINNMGITITKLYSCGPHTLVLPKYGFAEFIKKKKGKKMMGELGAKSLSKAPHYKKNQRNLCTAPANFYWIGKLSNYQEIAKKYIMCKYLNQKKVNAGMAGLILSLPTGHGKTFVCMSLIHELKTSTLIICPTIRIATQWIKLLKQYFPRVKIGELYSNGNADGDIIVCVINSLLTDEIKIGGIIYSSKKFISQWNLVIFDESHNYSSRKRIKIYKYISADYTIGLSATPEKHFCKEATLWNIGPVLHSEQIPDYTNTYKQNMDHPPFRMQITCIKHMASAQYTKILHNKFGDIDFAETLNLIISDPARLQLITSNIIELYNNDYCILVFSDRIAYLNKISDALCNVPESTKKILDNQILTGGATNKEMDKAMCETKIILTTYKFFSEGISISKINAIVYATPRKKGIVQSAGRALRPSNNCDVKIKKKENEKMRRIVDIVDWHIPFARTQWKKRLQEYNKLKKNVDIEIIMRPTNYCNSHKLLLN